MDKLIPPLIFTQIICNELNQNPAINQQLEYFSMLATKKIKLDEFFKFMQKLEDTDTTEYIKVEWDELKKENAEHYHHERSHFDTYTKYGIKSSLYRILGTSNTFCVRDENMQEVALEQSNPTQWVIDVYKESAFVTFSHLNVLPDNMWVDVLDYEALCGNIEKIDYTNIFKILSKYKWRKVYLRLG